MPWPASGGCARPRRARRYGRNWTPERPASRPKQATKTAHVLDLGGDRLLLDRSGGEASYYAAFDKGEQDEHRDGGHHRGAEQVLPVDRVLADETVQADGQRRDVVARRQGECGDELIPCRDEREDQRRDHAGQCQREGDTENRAEPAA